MSEATPEESSPHHRTRIDEDEVAQIQASIQEALPEAQYFDASSMAPLSSLSLVSVSDWRLLTFSQREKRQI